MKKVWIIGGILVGIVLIVVGAVLVLFLRNSDKNITDFASCAKKYPVMETYPEQCQTKDGRTFTNPVDL